MIKNFLRGLVLAIFLADTSMVSADNPGENTLDKPQVLENYSFDFSSHKLPVAYSTYGAAVQIHHKYKLIPDVQSRYGAIVLNKVSHSH